MTDTPHDSPDRRASESAAAADARGRLRARFVVVLAAFVVLWVLIEGITLWSRFPDRVPVHFGLHGTPDGWAGKNVFTVYGPILLIAVVVALTSLALVLSPRHCNFPGKDRMLRLPPHHQEHVIAPIREVSLWTGAGVGIGFAILCRQMWAVALGDQQKISPWPVIIGLAIGFVALIIGTLHARRRMAHLEQAQ
jgi:uncharacterized membrane protein